MFTGSLVWHHDIRTRIAGGKVFVFGPDSCTFVSTVGNCEPNLIRPVSQEWAANSPCLGMFDPPTHTGLACGELLRLVIVVLCIYFHRIPYSKIFVCDIIPYNNICT